jgi:hypothetical protein
MRVNNQHSTVYWVAKHFWQIRCVKCISYFGYFQLKISL